MFNPGRKEVTWITSVQGVGYVYLTPEGRRLLALPLYRV